MSLKDKESIQFEFEEGKRIPRKVAIFLYAELL